MTVFPFSLGLLLDDLRGWEAVVGCDSSPLPAFLSGERRRRKVRRRRLAEKTAVWSGRGRTGENRAGPMAVLSLMAPRVTRVARVAVQEGDAVTQANYLWELESLRVKLIEFGRVAQTKLVRGRARSRSPDKRPRNARMQSRPHPNSTAETQLNQSRSNSNCRQPRWQFDCSDGQRTRANASSTV